MGVTRENDVEFWCPTGNLAGNRKPSMRKPHYEIGLFTAAQLIDEIAQALDPARIHAAKFRRRLPFAGTDVSQADDYYLYPLPLKRNRGREQTFPCDRGNYNKQPDSRGEP